MGLFTCLLLHSSQSRAPFEVSFPHFSQYMINSPFHFVFFTHTFMRKYVKLLSHFRKLKKVCNYRSRTPKNANSDLLSHKLEKMELSFHSHREEFAFLPIHRVTEKKGKIPPFKSIIIPY